MDPLQPLTPAKPKAIKAKTAKPSDKTVKSSDTTTKSSDKAAKSSNKAAKPSKTTKQKVLPAKSILKTPVAPVSIFAARQIEASHNKQAASLLFTPHKQRGGQIRFTHEQESSPTRQPAPQNLPSQLGTSDGESDRSDVEEELVGGLQHLDFRAGSESHSGSESGSGSRSSSQSSSGSQSVSSVRSHSRAQLPRAGPHSKHFSAVQCQEVVLKMSGHFSQRSRDGMSVYYASEFPHYKSIVYRVIGVSDMLTSLSPHMLLLHLA
jgi:hypothetical protein